MPFHAGRVTQLLDIWVEVRRVNHSGMTCAFERYPVEAPSGGELQAESSVHPAMSEMVVPLPECNRVGIVSMRRFKCGMIPSRHVLLNFLAAYPVNNTIVLCLQSAQGARIPRGCSNPAKHAACQGCGPFDKKICDGSAVVVCEATTQTTTTSNSAKQREHLVAV